MYIYTEFPSGHWQCPIQNTFYGVSASIIWVLARTYIYVQDCTSMSALPRDDIRRVGIHHLRHSRAYLWNDFLVSWNHRPSTATTWPLQRVCTQLDEATKNLKLSKLHLPYSNSIHFNSLKLQKKWWSTWRSIHVPSTHKHSPVHKTSCPPEANHAVGWASWWSVKPLWAWRTGRGVAPKPPRLKFKKPGLGIAQLGGVSWRKKQVKNGLKIYQIEKGDVYTYSNYILTVKDKCSEFLFCIFFVHCHELPKRLGEGQHGIWRYWPRKDVTISSAAQAWGNMH